MCIVETNLPLPPPPHVHEQEVYCTERGAATLGIYFVRLFFAVAWFAVGVSLELLKAGLACKLHFASHVVPRFFSAR